MAENKSKFSFQGFLAVFLLVLPLFIHSYSTAQNASQLTTLSTSENQHSAHIYACLHQDLETRTFLAENEENCDDDEKIILAQLGFSPIVFKKLSLGLFSKYSSVRFFKTTSLFILFQQLKIPFC
ncbi:hypothetical protein [Lacihabitans sp. LS3-19]|uniref:hypothetical protein n=1 Tax=Lacihabitans sp. LS3-19 TaxID=2487335 RepID=UPI0020CD9321|nr:hypothetical protein [Lacihabitans sp. LS3-19]